MELHEFWLHYCSRCNSKLRGDEKDGCEVCMLMTQEEARAERHRNLRAMLGIAMEIPEVTAFGKEIRDRIEAICTEGQ